VLRRTTAELTIQSWALVCSSTINPAELGNIAHQKQCNDKTSVYVNTLEKHQRSVKSMWSRKLWIKQTLT